MRDRGHHRVDAAGQVRAAGGPGSWDSEPARLTLRYEKPLEKPELYVLAVGVSHYAQAGLDLKYPDADARAQLGAQNLPKDSSLSTLAVAIAAQAPPWGRLTVEYDHNTNALGIAAGGAPTTLGSDALTLRAQLVF